MSRIKLQSEYKDLDKYDNGYGDIYYYKKDTNIRHNPYGPSVVSEHGYKEYWINNKYLIKEKFELHPERLKFLGKDYLISLI